MGLEHDKHSLLSDCIYFEALRNIYSLVEKIYLLRVRPGLLSIRQKCFIEIAQLVQWSGNRDLIFHLLYNFQVGSKLASEAFSSVVKWLRRRSQELIEVCLCFSIRLYT